MPYIIQEKKPLIIKKRNPTPINKTEVGKNKCSKLLFMRH